MDRLKYWRLQSRFSVRQAAALQIGINPAEFGDLLERGDDDWIYDYEAIVAAFIDALKTSELEGDIHWVEQDYIPFSNYSPEPEDIDINKTMIPRENITSYLSAINPVKIINLHILIIFISFVVPHLVPKT